MDEVLPQEARDALWGVGILQWKLWPQQFSIYNSIRSLPRNVDEPVLLLARQYGKSHLGVLMAAEDCIRFPNSCILIVGPTYEQCRDIVVPRLEKIIADAPPGMVKRLKSEKKWLIGDSELVIGGFDINSSSQRGKTVQNIYIEEVVDSHPDHYLESMRSDLGPALTHSDAGKMIFLTTLPKVPDHPFILETMAKAELNGCLYVYTIDDNKQLTAEQYEACVRRSGGRHTDDFKREYLCQIIRDRSVVIIPDFNKATDVEAFEVPRVINLEVYIDWGGVRDLTVALLMGYDFLAGRDLVIDELWFPHNTPTEDIVRTIRDRWGIEEPTHYLRALGGNMAAVKRHYADVPGQLQVDLKSTHNYQITLPPKSDWEASINNLANRFTQRKMKLHPRCKLAIQTCQSGVLNKNRTDFDRTSTLGHMDAVATLMYGNRALDRSSPYSEQIRSHDWHWVKPVPKQPDIVPTLKLASPKGMRKFGK